VHLALASILHRCSLTFDLLVQGEGQKQNSRTRTAFALYTNTNIDIVLPSRWGLAERTRQQQSTIHTLPL
jgi:hypothetical protein